MLRALGFITAFSGVWVFLCSTRVRYALPLFVAGLIMLFVGGAFGRDLGQWGDNPAEITQWYRSLMQPDNPTVSCCGEADAYWCDDIHVRDGETYCTITDDRDDAPRHRPHVPVGMEILIPNAKLKWDRGNPTGHAIVFLSATQHVYCFVQGTGI